MDCIVRLGNGRAIGRARVNVIIVRAFAKIREALRGTPELARKLAGLEKRLTARLDVHEAAIVQVLQEVMQILNPPPTPARRGHRLDSHPDVPGDLSSVLSDFCPLTPVFSPSSVVSCPRFALAASRLAPCSQIPACHAVVPRLQDEGRSR